MSFDNLNLDNLNAIDTQYKPENYKVQTSADEIFGDDYNAKSEENEIEVEKSSESLTVCNDPILPTNNNHHYLHYQQFG